MSDRCARVTGYGAATYCVYIQRIVLLVGELRRFDFKA